MYRELESKAWPMTKLLSALERCTPEGIDLEQIRVDEDRIRVSGRAKPDPKSNLIAQQVVTLMQQNLRDSKIFDKIYLTWGDPDNFGHYEFTLSARVVNPYRRHEFPVDLDYGVWTRRDAGLSPPEWKVRPGDVRPNRGHMAIVDLQVASMGGMAVTRAIRDREHPVPVIILLDLGHAAAHRHGGAG